MIAFMLRIGFHSLCSWHLCEELHPTRVWEAAHITAGKNLHVKRQQLSNCTAVRLWPTLVEQPCSCALREHSNI